MRVREFTALVEQANEGQQSADSLLPGKHDFTRVQKCAVGQQQCLRFFPGALEISETGRYLDLEQMHIPAQSTRAQSLGDLHAVREDGARFVGTSCRNRCTRTVAMCP